MLQQTEALAQDYKHGPCSVIGRYLGCPPRYVRWMPTLGWTTPLYQSSKQRHVLHSTFTLRFMALWK